MTDSRLSIVGPAALAALVLFACSGPTGEAPVSAGGTRSAEALVYAVNYPLQYFAERIGGGLVRVEFPAPAGLDPAAWVPETAVVAEYQQADLVLLNGAGYAGWILHSSLSPTKTLDTSAEFSDRYLEIEAAATHTHGPEGEHTHGELAFTTWLDFGLALEQARAIERAFIRTWPENAEAFGRGLESLRQDLEELDRELAAELEGLKDPPLASHPVYQYLARAYDISIVSFHFEPDLFPSEEDWRQLDEIHQGRAFRWMLWEGAPLDRTIDALAERGIEVVVFNPCANRPASGDFLDVMRANVSRLRSRGPTE